MKELSEPNVDGMMSESDDMTGLVCPFMIVDIGNNGEFNFQHIENESIPKE